MTTGEMLRHEGIAEGILEGRALTLPDLLTAKFGDLPASLCETVHSASDADLATWTIRILTADTIDDVSACLAAAMSVPDMINAEELTEARRTPHGTTPGHKEAWFEFLTIEFGYLSESVKDATGQGTLHDLET